MTEPEETVSVQVVVLERVEPGELPSYAATAKSTCMACPEWVWLPPTAVKPVQSGEMIPICLACATGHPQIRFDTLLGTVEGRTPPS